jgi:hypothetical protein
VEIAVSLSCTEDSSRGHIFSVYDISLSGMAIHSDTQEPEVGDTLCLCLSERRDECSRDHVIEATVVHAHHDHVGIRFDSVGIHILKDIQRLLRDGRSF